VTLDDGTPVQVACPKKLDRFVQLQTTATLAPEHQAALDKMSKEERESFAVRIQKEMGRARLDSWTDSPTSFHTITVGHPVAIVTLTEGVFLQNMMEMAAASKL